LITQAWWIANLSRKSPPALDRFIKKRHREPQQTVAQARTVVELLSAQYGIPMRKTRIRLVKGRKDTGEGAAGGK